jgi:hypothetical protein
MLFYRHNINPAKRCNPGFERQSWVPDLLRFEALRAASSKATISVVASKFWGVIP